MKHPHDRERFAWAKLNAYGILLAGLTLMGVADLINPGGADLAKLVGSVPDGQAFWVGGFVVSGVLLLGGFTRGDRLAETLGLILLTLALILETVVAWTLLGWDDQFTVTRLAIIGLVGFCAWARISVLWSRGGFRFTIPPRDETPSEHPERDR